MPDKNNDLETVLEALELSNDNKGKELLIKYIDLLFKWHKKNNILSTRDRKYFIQRDLFDSLSIIKELPAGDLLDIGTGAGIPGILISFFRPEIKVSLLDRRDNAIRFLEHAKLKLDLNNVNIIKTDAKKMNIEDTPKAVLIKNFSNKIISKLNFEDKLMHIINIVRAGNCKKTPIFMLTGSLALNTKNISAEFEATSKSNFTVKKIDTPYFSTNRFLLVITHV
tara:strand:+ start:615 stop:1286 length:672 start_codon:yes stop_codon:yes gene_type:complete